MPKDRLYDEQSSYESSLSMAAARYLKRNVYMSSSNIIAAGVYTPSTLITNFSGNCKSSSIVEAIIEDIQTGKRSKSQLETIGPFGKIPPDEIHWGPKYNDRSLTIVQPFDGQKTQEALPYDYYTYAEDLHCDEHHQITLSKEKDLDYVILITKAASKKNSRTIINADQRGDGSKADVLLQLGLAQREQQNAELAAATYAERDLWKLVTLLPLKYRAVPDNSLALPVRLEEEVKRSYHSTYSSVMKNIAVPASEPELTFDRTRLNKDLIDYGAWFQAMTFQGEGKFLYVSPLLARAPFYICYNKGAYQYVADRYQLIKKISRDVSAEWQAMAEGDIASLAKSQVSHDAQYRRCIESQLQFVLTHEIAHIIQDPAKFESVAATEIHADCFAFIITNREKNFDLSLFENLVLNQSKEKNSELLAGRLTSLRKLSNRDIPALSSEESINYCQDWTKKYLEDKAVSKVTLSSAID